MTSLVVKSLEVFARFYGYIVLLIGSPFLFFAFFYVYFSHTRLMYKLSKRRNEGVWFRHSDILKLLGKKTLSTEDLHLIFNQMQSGKDVFKYPFFSFLPEHLIVIKFNFGFLISVMQADTDTDLYLDQKQKEILGSIFLLSVLPFVNASREKDKSENLEFCENTSSFLEGMSVKEIFDLSRHCTISPQSLKHGDLKHIYEFLEFQVKIV